ncbi:uncharacterized protein ELE39_000434 [Cryptosporidium sp. chipmunk genotype I]|uniref:uncharacterized protein n=1 Tax=Cryptosporidium sp. chipmunk genotype I TaxID=1280935 RepID=UPI00351A963F|nr:hypothetical protein ELE39_000434 [Cryptosporidium sp. chipmunk genotype I]
MDFLKSSIHRNMEEEFAIEVPSDSCCFQSGTAQSTFSMGFEEDTCLRDSIRTFQDDPDFTEHFNQNLDLSWNESSSFDQKKQELKELTFELATDPSPNSEFLVKVTETLDSILQDEFKVLDFKVSTLVKQNTYTS